MNILNKLEEMLLFSDSRKIIAQYILEKEEELPQYTLQNIADDTFTSKATLVRFAKKLGYEGWKDFLYEYILAIKNKKQYYQDIDVNIPFNKDNNVKEIIQNISDLQIESILETANILNEEMLNKAIKYLINAKRIIIMGISPNSLIAEIFRRKMLSIGMIIDIPKYDEYGAYSYLLNKDDCVILISYGGNSINTSIINKLKNNNVNIIALTSNDNNYLNNNIDCKLYMSSREKLYNKISSFSTEISIITIFNILYSLYFKENYDENLNYKINTFSLLEDKRKI